MSFYLPDPVWRLICYLLTHTFYRFKSYNLPQIPKDEAAILTCNHVSFVDWLVISASFNRPVRFVMDYRIYKNPLLRYFVKSAKVIPIVPRKINEAVYENSFKLITESLNKKELICIFPEGRITDSGSLNTFKSGIERIVTENPLPVYPLVLKGLYGSFFSRSHKGKAFSNPLLLLKNFRKSISLEGLGRVESREAKAHILEELTRKSF